MLGGGGGWGGVLGDLDEEVAVAHDVFHADDSDDEVDARALRVKHCEMSGQDAGMGFQLEVMKMIYRWGCGAPWGAGKDEVMAICNEGWTGGARGGGGEV